MYVYMFHGNAAKIMYIKIPYFAFTRIRRQIAYREAMKAMGKPSRDSASRATSTMANGSTSNAPGIVAMESYERQMKGAVHIPQTLDEFYYQHLADIDSRTTDQVLYRHQGLPGRVVKEHDRFICIVDQFWLYVVDDGMHFAPYLLSHVHNIDMCQVQLLLPVRSI
jgi:hypothetical protein